MRTILFFPINLKLYFLIKYNINNIIIKSTLQTFLITKYSGNLLIYWNITCVFFTL